MSLMHNIWIIVLCNVRLLVFYFISFIHFRERRLNWANALRECGAQIGEQSQVRGV